MGQPNSKQTTEDVDEPQKEPRTIPTTLAEKETQATLELMEEHSKNVTIAAERISRGEKQIPFDNSMFEYNYQRLELPKDEEGYCQAFTPEQEQEYLEFFNTYGVVVVSNILNDEECIRTENEIWEFITRETEGRVDRNDPATWEYWPALKKLGILGNTILLSPQAFENRQNPKLARVFEVLLGTDDLMVNVGRASAMRPTRNLLINGELVDKPEWKTITEWIHWDMNPWTGLTTTFSWAVADISQNCGYDSVKVQGVLSCVDCGPNEGGFHCIPGFQHHIRGWANANLDKFNPQNFEVAGSIQVPKNDPIRNDVQTVPIRKGSILIWNSCLPHGTFPNDSDKFRMIQYIKMARADDPSIAPLFRDPGLLPSPDLFQLTPLGRKLLRLDN